MKSYRIVTSQNLTQNGLLGVWLFLLSPIFGGAFYYWYLVTLSSVRGTHPALPASLVMLSGLGFLGGAVLIIVGRTLTHSVTEIDSSETGKTEGLWMR